MLEIYFDGLCEPHPSGIATFGFVVKEGEKAIKTGYGVVGEGKGMTNNVAEFSALLKALDSIGDEKDIMIKGDSQLVINQLSKNWKLRSETSKKFCPLIWEKLKGRNVKYLWIPREENQECDRLSRKAYKQYISILTDKNN